MTRRGPEGAFGTADTLPRAPRGAEMCPDEDTPIDQVVVWLRESFPREYRVLTVGGAIHAALDELDAARARIAELEKIERRARDLLAAARATPDGQAHEHAARYILDTAATPED